MAFYRLVVLLLVVMVMTDVMAAKKGGKMKRKKDTATAIAALKTKLEALEKTCSGNKVHFFFHGDDDHSHDHDDGSTHVHVDLHMSDHDHDTHAHVHHEHVAMCKMSDSIATGTVTIVQGDNDKSANFHLQFQKTAHENTDYRIHVHQFGDLSNNCKNVGGHYDPYHANDVGDLGTVRSDENGAIVDVWKNDTHLTMFGEYSILGRSIMIHDDHDHVACCMIGVSPETHDHDEDHSHDHDHFADDHSAHDNHASHDHSEHGHSHSHDHKHDH